LVAVALYRVARRIVSFSVVNMALDAPRAAAHAGISRSAVREEVAHMKAW